MAAVRMHKQSGRRGIQKLHLFQKVGFLCMRQCFQQSIIAQRAHCFSRAGARFTADAAQEVWMQLVQLVACSW
jgi:hypothetical protein